MGIFTTQGPVQLVPVHPPVAVFTPFIAQSPTTLVLREKMWSWTGDDFSVKDAATGQPVVRCEGKAFSMRERKHITDASGRPLFALRNKMMTIHKTFIGEDEAGHELFRVRKHMSFGTKMTATFRNAATGQDCELSVKGDMFGMGSVISLNDTQPVAQISRQYMNAGQLWGDKQTYFVTVSPGVDLALIAAICIAFDEAKNDQPS